MRTKRLLRLVKLLRDDAKNDKGVKFDLTLWAGPANAFASGHRWHYVPQDNALPEVSCGTSACAMGLATISGEFKREGLYHVYSGYVGHYALEPRMHDRHGNVRSGFGAAEVLFGLTATQSEYLFAPMRYKKEWRRGAEGERYVARRIMQLVKDNGFIPRGVGRNNMTKLDEYYRYD